MSSGFTIYPLGDHAITIEFGEQINHETNQQVLSLFHYLQSKPFQGLLDLIPAYTTLTVVYDVFQLKQYCQKTQTVYDWLEQRIVYILQTQQSDLTSQGYLFSGVIIFLGNISVLLIGLPLLTARPYFATGWLKDNQVLGRPAGLITGTDGALYISDDNKGFIYRVSYGKK